ncbi:hypothetical protein DFQ01_12178 [Paenibacillus cellulosilyticus]|uniref:Uncharacterized protein n=1 Tax=Paenibacillus cellulosilyticus TaxID=375489 RepID=A0A2V2YPZ5_9BACL|nr:DUF6711 family protein [Paenibacillus cellulosilyticus]PWV97434.1 hypothetical protein DFQ01_12178 [Paenibacillus cellulosilyticus]QKS48527.1 hypothetical protein HUB94_30295 [Paenibacillus cellulosilyticus]
MELKIDGQVIASYPSQFTVTTMDLDDGDSTTRTADGTLTRDRVAVKRQIEMQWGVIKWSIMSALLQSMSGVFFDFTYPDPMTGQYETKTFYVGNRPAPVAVSKGGEILWSGLKVTLTER